MIEGDYREGTANMMEALLRGHELIVEIVHGGHASEHCLRLGSEDFSSTLTLAETNQFVAHLEGNTATVGAKNTTDMCKWIERIRTAANQRAVMKKRA